MALKVYNAPPIYGLVVTFVLVSINVVAVHPGQAYSVLYAEAVLVWVLQV